MNISPDSCIVITPSHLRRHVCDFKMHNVSLKKSAKHATVPGLDDPAQSHFSCFLLLSPILHELEKKLCETTALLCLVLVQAKQSIPSCWLEQLFAQRSWHVSWLSKAHLYLLSLQIPNAEADIPSSWQTDESIFSLAWSQREWRSKLLLYFKRNTFFDQQIGCP